MSDIVREQLSLYREQAERWKREHVEAMLVFDFEGLVALGISCFDQLNRLDERIRLHELRSEMAHQPDVHDGVTTLYRDWLDTGRRVLSNLEWLEARSWTIAGAQEFRSRLREVEGILTPDEDFFSGPKLDALVDRANEEHRAGSTDHMKGMCD